jgi:hypothetical protein
MPSSDASCCIVDCYDLDFYKESVLLKSIKSKNTLLNALKEFCISFDGNRETYLLDPTFKDKESNTIKVKYKKIGEFIPKPNEDQLLLYAFYISRDSSVEFDYLEDEPIVVNYKKLEGSKVIETVEQEGEELELEHQGCADSVIHCFGYRVLLSNGKIAESEVDEVFMHFNVEDIDDETSARLDEIAGKWYSEISKLK